MGTKSPRIATVVNVHGNTPLVLDTLDALRTYSSENNLVLVDGAVWDSWGKDIQLPAHKICGFVHNQPRAPYRNVAFGLMSLVNQWNDMDWYCYTEYDTLYANDLFKEDLAKASKQNIWCLGTNHRIGSFKFPLIERMLGIELKESHYLLGCCVFFHRKFVKKLKQINFFEKFLQWTNEFRPPYFPGYDEQGGYDISEHLYPTLANHFGGKVGQLSSWSDHLATWERGNFLKYPIRWKPELTADYPLYNASILHPVKQYNHVFRLLSRKKRKNKNA